MFEVIAVIVIEIEICLLHLCCEFVIFEICTLISLIDKYGALVTGEAAEHVKQFISSECSFEDYTQVMICLRILSEYFRKNSQKVECKVLMVRYSMVAD